MRLYRPRKLLFPARLAVRHVTRAVTGNFHTDPAWIPGPFLPYFSVVEDTRPIFEAGALPFTSVFDLLRKQDRSFFYGAHPVSGNDEEIHRMLLDRIRARAKIDLYVAQFSALDEGGHHHGPLLPPDWTRAEDQRDPDVEFMRRALKGIDEKCRTLHEELSKSYDEVNFLVLGDHGMAPVRRRVNVLAALKKSGLKMGRDYVLFLDSTFAKVWFESEAAREEIPRVLEGLRCGRILDAEDRARLRIRIPGRRYGDLLFAADPGILFWPDYFHVVENPIRGMHGYVDKREETVGALLLHGAGRAGPVGERSLVDVFPTLCDLLDLETPKSNEGVSLLDDASP
jgi:predicted AlkP superfamily pyrophosphatase or phosphodiesterase